MKTEIDPTLDEEIAIRRAETVADYRACQEACAAEGNRRRRGYLFPVATMVGSQFARGLVLGGFLAQRHGRRDVVCVPRANRGRLCLVLAAWQREPRLPTPAGLGYRIKLLQRDVARGEGIEVIAWAFDPLQAGNAHFNLARLGVISGRYVANMYGERTDRLNAGVPTDRLIVEWSTAPAPPVAVSAESAGHLLRA